MDGLTRMVDGGGASYGSRNTIVCHRWNGRFAVERNVKGYKEGPRAIGGIQAFSRSSSSSSSLLSPSTSTSSPASSYHPRTIIVIVLAIIIIMIPSSSSSSSALHRLRRYPLPLTYNPHSHPMYTNVYIVLYEVRIPGLKNKVMYFYYICSIA